MRLSLIYSDRTVISACNHPCDASTFTHSLTKINLFQLKTCNLWTEFFWNEKIFYLGIYKRNINPKAKYIFDKTVHWHKWLDFHWDYLSKPRSFQTFQQVIIISFLTDFKISDFLPDVISMWQFSCLKKTNTAIFKFSVLSHKIKLKIYNFYMAI